MSGSGPIWRLFFRGFFPSWRFFEDSGPSWELTYRVGSDKEFSEIWTPVSPRETRRLAHLWIHASGNLFLAKNGLIDALLDDESPPERLAEAVSYRLIGLWIEEEIGAAQNVGPPPKKYQFKIENKTSTGSETIFTSLVHRI